VGGLTIQTDLGVHEVPLSGAAVGAPGCDDGDPCTEDTYDLGSGQCLHALYTGPCDDGDACTIETVCVAGACVGTTLSCSDGDPCTVDSCDPTTGCVAAPLPASACDDGSSCTNDRCEPGVGCVSVPVADGTPCDDGRACTVDACVAGTCVGDPSAGPEELSRTRTWGGAYHSPITPKIGPGGLVLFPESHDAVWTLRVVRRTGDRLELVHDAALPGVVDYGLNLFRLGDDGLFAWVAHLVESPTVFFFTVAPDGSVQWADNVVIPVERVENVVRDGDVVYVSTHPAGVAVVEIADRDAPVRLDPLLTRLDPIRGLTVASGRLFVSGGESQPRQGIEVYDLADPRAPDFVTTVLPGQAFGALASGAGWVAATPGGQDGGDVLIIDPTTGAVTDSVVTAGNDFAVSGEGSSLFVSSWNNLDVTIL